MSIYEQWTLFLAALALLVSALSYEKARRAIKLAEEANEISATQLRENAALNSPNLVFDCHAVGAGAVYKIFVTVFNAGGHSTEIIEGEVRLHSDQYPEADKPHKLAGHQIGGRSQHVIEIEQKASFIHGSGAGVTTAEIICEAIYSRPNQKNGHAEVTYAFDVGTGEFVVKK